MTTAIFAHPAPRREQAIFAYDCGGLIVDANTNFMRLSGYSRAALIGQPLALIAGAMVLCEAFLASLRRGRIQQGDFERQGRDGRFATCETHIPVMNRKGQLERVLVLARVTGWQPLGAAGELALPIEGGTGFPCAA